jgi:hypothetical protein
MLKLYYPYESDKPTKKFFIITNEGKRVYFGSAKNKDYTIYYKEQGKEIADKKRNAYIARHSKLNEKWGIDGINTAGYWSFKFLWLYPTYKKAYTEIQKEIKRMIY